jgi:hypothetical protein
MASFPPWTWSLDTFTPSNLGLFCEPSLPRVQLQAKTRFVSQFSFLCSFHAKLPR